MSIFSHQDAGLPLLSWNARQTELGYTVDVTGCGRSSAMSRRMSTNGCTLCRGCWPPPGWQSPRCSNPKPAEARNELQRSDETFRVSSCSYLHQNADLFVPRLWCSPWPKAVTTVTGQGTSQVELDVGSAPTTSGHRRFEQGDDGIMMGSTCRSTRGRQRRGRGDFYR